jgi:hypothetical protein
MIYFIKNQEAASMKEQGNTMKGAMTAMHTFVTICAQQAHGC